MDIMVTGGLGFIGSNFIQFLQQHKPSWTVVNLDSNTYAGDEFRIQNCNNVILDLRSDILDISSIESIPTHLDAVVHFAAETHNDRAVANPEIFTRTNVLGTEQILKFCLRRNIKLHYVSTDEVFGDMPVDSLEVFAETSPIRPSNPYSASKAAGGLLVDAWARTFGLRASISTCGNNYGRNQNAEKFIPKSIALASSGLPIELYGSGENVRDWVAVEDHCSAIVFILENGLAGTYNIGVRDEWTNLAIAQAINTLVGNPTKNVRFVRDRPGHDRRYALSNTKLESEGWLSSGQKLESSLPRLLELYSATA